ncbi:MAG: serpin family protein [Candidatus Aenigmarchaeota archaeon]|nr:serpin family protein [Candidatus Aenigmarchaeota archaeon]
MHHKISTNAILIAAIFLVVTASGCVDNETTVVVDSSVTSEDVNSVVNANNQFAFDLYSEFKSEEGNVFFSPYSISTALAMTYEGAKGKTAEEMQNVLHIPEDSTIRMPAFARIYNEINKGDKEYELSTANALWAQQDYIFLDEYTNNVEKYYGGKITNLDFITETEKSRQIINTWVEDQTNNKIKDLLPQGVLNALTRLVLTNAIYFKGTWTKQFDKKDTKEEDFTTSSGQTSKVPMMSLTGDNAKFNYAETNDAQILELPYDNDDLSMLIILPKENDLGALEESLNSENVPKFKSMLRKQRVDIYIPKFKFETKYFMVETLKKMGMPTAFTSTADFSGMDGTKNMYIANVIHQAFVEVNEEGTEAAAATAVVMQITSASMEPLPIFRANHPFIFLIQQKSTGNILFLGRVSNPCK